MANVKRCLFYSAVFFGLQIMKFIFCYWLLLPSLGLAFQQKDYKVIFERVEIVEYNTTYVGFAKSHNFKYNRTNAVVNMTFVVLKDLVGKLDMEVQAYRFASNEYRLFPMRFSFDFCKSAHQNDFGLGELYRCGNLTRCPFKKGDQHVCNWAPNGTRFPPNVPQGSYMLDLKFIYHEIEVVFFQLFLTSKYPEVKAY